MKLPPYDQISELLLALAAIDNDAWLTVGDIPSNVGKFWKIRSTELILTGERYHHILERHPEMAGLEPELFRALLDPDEIHRNRHDASMVILFRGLRGGQHYIRAAVLLAQQAGQHNSVISAWKLRRGDHERALRRGMRLWEREV